jgi:AbrB family looped-hinge helix DNA binding protein
VAFEMSSSFLEFLADCPYIAAMKATLTSKGQVTIPTAIRERLGLKAGQILDFDENAPFVKAVPVFDEEEMHSVIGCTKGGLGCSSMKWLENTRGPVALPQEPE